MAKNSSRLDRVPPFMPILWQEWESDPDISTMTDLQVGIFFKMLLRQWVVGSVPAKVSDIIRECKLDSGRNTVLRFLESYPHLWTCDGCGADFVRAVCGCSMDAGRTSDVHPTDATRTNNGRRAYARRTNARLKNLRIDVNFGLELGTTEPNQTEREPEPEPRPNEERQSKLEPESVSVEDEPPAPKSVPLSLKLEQKAPRPASMETTSPASPELSDIRTWNEDRFGLSADRIRNCLIYHLDYNPSDWLRKDPPTVASMGRKNFIRALDKNTPPGWTPEKHRLKTTPEAAANSAAEEKAALDLVKSLGGRIYQS